ncbi:MAG: tetratricopeptide repeat protein, partial [Chitinivibrionales bacterium]|nr:tetratricopeptide repeat protein [Chitinivibrionales bacterium]MBD3356442.1 tetratricopeptide repeat protein [Chitinivibrionales bacterium]
MGTRNSISALIALGIIMIPLGVVAERADADGDHTKPKVLVAWPVDASGRGNDTEWFSAPAGHQLWFRLSASNDIEVLLSDKSKLISASRARQVARERGASYAILQSFEILSDQKTVHYYAEAVGVEHDLDFVPIEKTFAIEEIGKWVDSCALRFTESIKLPLNEGLHRFYRIPAINITLKSLRRFGANAAKQNFSSVDEAIEVARRHKAIVDADPRNLLAHYLSAKAYLAGRRYAEAAELLKDFLTIVPNHAALYLDAARSFRLCGQYQQTLEMAALAEREGVRGTALLREGAEALVKLGRSWKAARVYETVFERDSTDEHALLFLAGKRARDGKLDEALAFAQRMTAAHPRNAQGHFEKGKAYMALGDREKAISSYEESLRLEPNADIHYLLGLCHDDMANYAEAIDAYKRYLDAYPEHADAMERIVEDYIKTDNAYAAAEYAAKLYKLNGDKYATYLAKAAFLYEEADSIERARELFAECVRKKLCDQKVNLHLAHIEYKRKNYKAVIELLGGLEVGVIREQGLVSALAESYCELEKYDKAVPWLRELIVENPDKAEPMRRLAVAFEKTGKVDRAIHTYRQLMNDVGDTARSDYGFRIGELYERIDDRAGAAETYRDNVTNFPDDIRNYIRLSQLCIEDNAWAEARELLIEIINFSESEPRYRKMLAEVCARQNDRVAAARSYREYLELKPGDVEAWKGLGDVHFERQLYAKAAESYRRAAESVGDDFHTLYRLGLCLLHTGDATAAVANLRRALKSDEKNPEVLEALAKAARSANDVETLRFALVEQLDLKPGNADIRLQLGELLI